MKHNRIEVQHPGDVNCFFSSVSILRLALGYKNGFPETLERPENHKAPLDWILENAGKMFTSHKVFTVGPPDLKEKAHNYLGEDMASLFQETGDFVWIYGFSTLDHFVSRLATRREPENHTVIGLPVIYEGMVPLYVIKIRLEL